jgi:hypothetical protein
MYTAFNLKIDVRDFEDPDDFFEIGENRLSFLKENSEQILKKFTMSDGTIDGTGLSDSWFEKVNSDVFISHSHNDRKLALILAGWLEQVFDLKVFLDECVWGSADALLRMIDNKKSLRSDGRYDYDKRNLTTSHVHAMLSTSIYSVMDRAEVVIFLNTEESVPQLDDVLDEDDSYTLSPWIYAEIMATKYLRRIEWNEYRIQKCLESAYREDSNELKIAYKLPTEGLVDLSVEDLINWQTQYIGRKNKSYRGIAVRIHNHPLNYLYELKFGKKV